MTPDELVPWLLRRRTGGIRWGLERTRHILAGAGDPHRRFASLLIGGTNGKGSVAALCEAALRAKAAHRVGLYTSPHLVSFRERIRIDGRPVEPELLNSVAERLRPAIENTDASFFEATTAIAFLCFAEAGVEIAAVEVGLGGRLDATNVLDPFTTAVTNVALDHTEYLGDTLEEIAVEKAGIFRLGTPALTAEMRPGPLAELRRRAATVGARFAALDELAVAEVSSSGLQGSTLQIRSGQWGEQTLRVSLPGNHQARNALLAAELLGTLPAEYRPGWAAVRAGFEQVRWPGRLQTEHLRGTAWLLDVAHNPAGTAMLAEALDTFDLPTPYVLVVSILADKNWRAMLPPLLDRTHAVLLTVPSSAPPDRRWNPDEVERWMRTELNRSARVIPHLPDALERAETLAPHGTVLVTGSVHTVGDVMAVLGIEP